jgi:hypothetical protein
MRHLISDAFAGTFASLSKNPQILCPKLPDPAEAGSILKTILTASGLEVERAAPRYYTAFAFLMAIPGLREFLAWNCAVLVRRKRGG